MLFILSTLLLQGTSPSEGATVINYLYLESIVPRMLTPQGLRKLVWNRCFCETLCFMHYRTIMNLVWTMMERLNALHKAVWSFRSQRLLYLTCVSLCPLLPGCLNYFLYLFFTHLIFFSASLKHYHFILWYVRSLQPSISGNTVIIQYRLGLIQPTL